MPTEGILIWQTMKLSWSILFQHLERDPLYPLTCEVIGGPWSMKDPENSSTAQKSYV